MLTRRTLLLSSLVLAATAAGASGGYAQGSAAQVSPQQASQLIDSTAKRLIAVIDGPGSAEQKRPALQQIIDSVVAVDEIGRFCLGRHWRSASPDEQRDYLELFHRVLLNSITGHLGDYRGITYTLGRPLPGEGGVQVPSTMNRPGQPSADLTWIVADVGGGPKIIDVVAAGTSMRLTQRSDYDSYLVHNGNNVKALLSALKRQVG